MLRFVVPCLVFMSGCAHFNDLTQPDRLDKGYTIVLPGIDGPSIANSNIAQGIADSGLETAIEVHDWTTGIPVMMPVHLYTKKYNKKKAEVLAAKIIDYQDRYPGRPVHLVAQSGGCGVLLWTLESLPPERKVTSAVMLSAAVSPTYDVSKALDRTEAGIWNFYSPFDVILLAGTTVGGNIDGRWMPGAGAVGMWSKPENTTGPRFVQVLYNPKMSLSGNFGGHWGPSATGFAREYVAPVLANAESRHPLAPIVNQSIIASDRTGNSTRYVVSSSNSNRDPYVHTEPDPRSSNPPQGTIAPVGVWRARVDNAN